MATRQRDEAVLESKKARVKQPPMFKVLLLNDDYTPMDFVVVVLQKNGPPARTCLASKNSCEKLPVSSKTSSQTPDCFLGYLKREVKYTQSDVCGEST